MVPPNPQMLHSPSVQSSRLSGVVAPTPSPGVQLVSSTPQNTSLPPPPPKDALSARNSGQLLSSVFNQLLHSDHESTIASLLSSSDGQSMGTPASVEPHHQRSPPLSVPSNCSYPATPGLNSNNNNSSCSNTNIPAASVTASNANPSPIGAIFEAAEVVVGGAEVNPNPAPPPPPPPPPRGLAAYLQKSRHPGAVASPHGEEGVDAYARQHGSVPAISSTSSSPWTERRGGGVQANSTAAATSGVYPATSSSSLTGTPNGQEGGKEKRGRRRRSELEELTNWQVRDQSTTSLKKPGFPPSQQIPTIVENSPPAQPTSAAPGRGPSDTEGPACFTEPLGERVKRRRQQHRTPPCSSSSLNNSSDVTRASQGSKGSAGKATASAKRSRGGGGGGDTSSELSISPKRRRSHATGHRHRHRLSSSDSEDLELEEVEEMRSSKSKVVNNDDAGASSSSCLTDSPVPRKHSLQRLVEEIKCRPPSLPRLDSLRVRGLIL